MTEKYLCPKCYRASYTPTLNIHIICSYCGFDYHSKKPDRRISKRVQIKELITLELNDKMRLKVNVIDTSDKGVGVIFPNHSSINKGDTVRYAFGKRGKQGEAKVVWLQEGDENQKAGLLLN